MLQARLLAAWICALWIFIGASTSAYGETLEAYSRTCDLAIGVTVPDFVCDNGTEVPATHLVNGVCDRPDQLHQDCDPGSRFQVLTNNASAYVVAHCRKRGNAINNGQYGDIAVIQHNRINGATCFYQALQALPQSLSGNVKAPSKGRGAWPWLTPAGTAAIGCAACHDNGPIIRSPYLTQITGANKLPGASDPTFNRDQPYYFVGDDFATWKAYKVEVNGNVCNGCHRMGVSNLGNGGTARDFGIRATALSQPHKNPHSADSPMWMLPGQTSYSQANADAAATIKQCADQFRENSPLPNSPSCKITLFTGPAAAPTLPGSYTAVWKPSTENEIQVYGWTYADYRNKYDQLWPLGWRLYSLEPYVVNGVVLYNAVWRPSTEGEIQVYGWTYEDYRRQYDQIWPQGWRLKILQPYVVSGQVRYTAVWHPST